MSLKTRVLIVDSSEHTRSLLRELIAAQPDFEVTGMAADPYEARELIKRNLPDLITLDIDLPRMSGVAFLRNLMRLKPMPVVMVSALLVPGSPSVSECQQLGAAAQVCKAADLREKRFGHALLFALRQARMLSREELERRSRRVQALSDAPAPVIADSRLPLIALGASTGGAQAVRQILTSLPVNTPPIVVTQHIPAQFSASFATLTNKGCAIEVVEARDRMRLRAGRALIAPGGLQMRVMRDNNGLYVSVLPGDRVKGHAPSVEVLFDSVADAGLDDAVAVLLTGMGDDGAAALGRLKQRGVHTIIQDRATSAVWGMPGVAHRLNAHCEMLPLDAISPRLQALSVAKPRDQGLREMRARLPLRRD